MRLLCCLIIFLSPSANARFGAFYSLNISNHNEAIGGQESDFNRTFHTLFLAGTVNGKESIFLGWNINSWSSTGERNSDKSQLSVLEMGPRLIWFNSDQYNYYFSLEWNPYVRGTRTSSAENVEIKGNSFSAGIGYRFEISRSFGLGAGLYYHSLRVGEEIDGETHRTVSDTINMLMPKLEISMIF
jgi:hypothetical protein